MPLISRLLLYSLILISGFSALVYEIVWTRHLSLLFGSNMIAVGTVTATFMAGLALGSLLFGLRADRSKNLLRLYAILEAGIALTAMLFPIVLYLIRNLYIVAVAANPESSEMIAVVRIGLAAIALLPPTICMGGTLPILCRFLATGNAGRIVGRLYALNTLGAVSGCLIGGFLLIPGYGMFAAQGLAVFGNLLIACLAWILSTKPGHQPLPRSEATSTALSERVPAGLLLAGAALLGASALANEMLWTRLFLLFLGNTTYAFSTILGVFLLGLTLGASVYSRFMSTRPNPALVYFALLSALVFYVLVSLPAYDQLGYLFESIHRTADGRWWVLATLSFFAVTLPVLVPATLSGALFPATVTLLKTNLADTGKTVGKALFWNTLGAMCGSFAGVFAITFFGLQNSFKVVALTTLVYAAGFAWVYRQRLTVRLTIIPLVGCLLLMVIPIRWDQGLMNSGIYIYAQYYLNTGGLGSPSSTQQPEEVVEGIETTAAFFRTHDGFMEFRVNGKSDGGTRPGDMKTQILLGQLPMLFVPEAKNVLVIGLGTGITLRQVLDYSANKVDCAEISPAVVSISRHFSPVNDNVLHSPKVNLLIEDGRNLLLTRPTTYDVIISEPSNPWQTGNANLFTEEFYQMATTKMTVHGVFCQWLPLYDLPRQQLQVALGTFASSFPSVRVFVLGGDIILLGSKAPLALDLPPLANHANTLAVKEHLSEAGLASISQLFERYYFANRDFLIEAANSAPLNTDNLPFLEFTHQTGKSHARTNLQYLVNVRQRMGSEALD